MIRAWSKALNDCLTKVSACGWRDRFDAEHNARKGKMKANSPREGFKAFLDAKEFAERLRLGANAAS